jgi:peptidoglycan/xylan/chitin deacetylase (PgdA/CDA1 family)
MRPLFVVSADTLTNRRELISTTVHLTAALIAAMMIMRPSIAMAQITASAPAPGAPAASQNPSPMVEQTRVHERLAPKPLGGVTRSFVGPAGKPVEMLIPDQVRTRDVFDLVVHFHGTAWLPEQAIAGLESHPVAAVVNLGTGSGTYDRAFADPTVFDSLLAGVAREVSAVTGKPARIGRVTLVGFSAGHGAVRAILRERRHFAKVDAVLLLDGMHTSYIPDGTVIAAGGTLDTTNLVAFAEFSRAAIRGEKRFLITHSEIFPGTFASTTETADWLLRTLGLRRTPVLRWGPRGMQQLSEVRAGRFELLGFAGNSAPDHIDQLHAMPELLARLFERSVSARPMHHYIFFGQDRDKLRAASSFLETKAAEGAQVAYSWRQLEPQKDQYDFSAVRDDLDFLTSHGKKLFLQLQDVSFSESRINVPRYLLQEAQYNGGADKQYGWKDGDEEHAVAEGWAARRWDPAVQERLHKLLDALGKEFDGRIEGINFAESSVGFGESGRLFPRGFSFAIYRDAIIANMKALKRAFPKSVAMQYANFMPGEWRPTEDKGYLRAVYDAAKDSNVGVGGPDLLPYRPGQLKSSYPLIRDVAGIVPAGIAVQDGNFEDVNPTTKKPVEISELIRFATEYLQVDYIFWGTQEPYYSRDVIPFLKRVESVGTSHSGDEETVAGGMLPTGGDPGNIGSNDRAPRREIAITFDDLPGVAMLRSQRCNSKAFEEVNRKLLRSIIANRIPAFGLVVEGNICQGQQRALPNLLGMWLDAGLDLGNHSFSHFDLNTTPLATYEADVVRGETVTRKVLQQRGKALRYFRHPFLHAGKDLATKRAFEKFLTERGYRIAPVTIDNQEWIFAEVYAVAKERKDKATADRVAAEYIKYMESVFDFFEKRSVEVTGREIKQVLLLHDNPLNADYLDELVRMMKRRGYSFISLDQALQDPAYRLPDNYAGPIGLSWIHRWGLTKGMALKNEPPEPEFIATLFRDYRN